MIKKACLEILEELKKDKIKDQDSFNILKIKISKKYRLKEILTNIKILCYLSKKDVEKFKDILITKPSRTSSGVTVVAVMSKPKKCEHGKCIYCPGGPGSIFGDVPQSYTGSEPATMRGIRNKFDSYLQVFNRLEHYVLMNHDISKVELIIMGGTFMSFDKKYRDEFVGYAFKALNDFSKMFFDKEFDLEEFKKFFELPGEVDDKKRTLKIQEKLLKLKGKCELVKEQLRNEKSSVRCVGLTIETRPDFADLEYCNEMLRLGCTRVELGVQSVYDNVLKKIERGHTSKESIEGIRILKDLGFKINIHYMVGLFVDYKKDLEGMKELFINEDYKPDMLKIYPCAVIKGTKLYDLWRNGEYKALSNEEAIKLISEFKKIVPEYCRIMRVQRDIPSKNIAAGVNLSNLRQYLDKNCKCIRCREYKSGEIGEVKLKVFEYNASKGKEFFISYENSKLLGFCRLRFPSQYLRKEIVKGSALIRELHVYGSSVKIGEKGKGIQHRGFGKKLLKKAEEICKKNNIKKIIVISGVGVREYYRKLGYKKEGVYMVKKLN